MKKREQNFSALMARIELQDCSDETISYQAEYKTFHLVFFADSDENFNVIVDDFYYRDKKNHIILLDASDEQIKQMQEIITNKVIEYANQIEDETQHHCNVCDAEIDSYGICDSRVCFESDNM